MSTLAAGKVVLATVAIGSAAYAAYQQYTHCAEKLAAEGEEKVRRIIWHLYPNP